MDSTKFTIPKGTDFSFTVTVTQADSFLAQDLTNMSSAVLVVMGLADQLTEFTKNLTVQDALNGVLAGTILGTDSANMVLSRGAAEDRYYLKPNYQATIDITFSDGTLPIHVLIEEVYVSPTGA